MRMFLSAINNPLKTMAAMSFSASAAFYYYASLTNEIDSEESYIAFMTLGSLFLAAGTCCVLTPGMQFEVDEQEDEEEEEPLQSLKYD